MAIPPSVTLAIATDTSSVVRTARIIAKHLTALADELEVPSAIIKFDGELTREQVDEIRERLKEGHA